VQQWVRPEGAPRAEPQPWRAARCGAGGLGELPPVRSSALLKDEARLDHCSKSCVLRKRRASSSEGRWAPPPAEPSRPRTDTTGELEHPAPPRSFKGGSEVPQGDTPRICACASRPASLPSRPSVRVLGEACARLAPPLPGSGRSSVRDRWQLLPAGGCRPRARCPVRRSQRCRHRPAVTEIRRPRPCAGDCGGAARRSRIRSGSRGRRRAGAAIQRGSRRPGGAASGGGGSRRSRGRWRRRPGWRRSGWSGSISGESSTPSDTMGNRDCRLTLEAAARVCGAARSRSPGLRVTAPCSAPAAAICPLPLAAGRAPPSRCLRKTERWCKRALC